MSYTFYYNLFLLCGDSNGMDIVDVLPDGHDGQLLRGVLAVRSSNGGIPHHIAQLAHQPRHHCRPPRQRARPTDSAFGTKSYMFNLRSFLSWEG